MRSSRFLLTAPGRVIIATFASQIARIQQIIDAAEESGRVVFATGRSMEKNIDMSRDLGYVRTDDRRLRPITDLGSAHDENTVIICTGAQGEPMAALSRMATGSHRDVELKPGDTVVLSSSPIPGNESAVNNTINNLYRRGVEVFSVGSGHEHVHVRGHAAQEELKTVLSLTEPQAFVPIHGEYRHLVLHSKLAESMEIAEGERHILLDGDVLELTAERSAVVDQVEASYVYVDGMNVGGVDRSIIRDRQKLAGDGIPAGRRAGRRGKWGVVRRDRGRGARIRRDARREQPQGRCVAGGSRCAEVKSEFEEAGALGQARTAGAAGGVGLSATRNETTSYGGSGGGTGLIGSIGPVHARLN